MAQDDPQRGKRDTDRLRTSDAAAAESGYPYVAIPQLRAGRIDLENARRITREHYLEWTHKAKPAANDVILSRRCNPGKTGVAPAELESLESEESEP